jgi:hypothetical protein
MMIPSEPNPLTRLLSPEAQILHRTLRTGFEKRIVGIDDDRKVLYRYYLPWQARKLAELLREANRRHLPLQKLLHHGADWQTLRAHKGFWVVTSYLDGQLWAGTMPGEENVVALARGLGGLHSITADHPGLLTSFCKKSGPRFKAGMLSVCKTAVNFAGHFDSRQNTEMIDWISKESRIFDELSCYQLLHGDLTAKNVLILRDKNIALIDYELFAYGVAGLELSRAMLGLLGFGKQRHRPVFLGTYLEYCPPEVRTHWLNFGAQLLIYQLLLMAHGRVIRFKILKKRSDISAMEFCYAQFQRNITDAYRLVRIFQKDLRDPLELLVNIDR